jgi:hypothetical protein
MFVAQTSAQPAHPFQSIDRRTLIVWATLFGSMTLATGLLMWLEPTPVRRTVIPLSAVDAPTRGIEAIYETQTPVSADRWGRIVIVHSGQRTGSARSLARLHRDLRYGSMGYHFVIGNGQGAPDGRIEVGPRWAVQSDGLYVDDAVVICLIGNGDEAPPTRRQMEQLRRLITSLQARLDIPADRVRLHSELAPTTSPGRFFQAGWLRQHLLTAMP